MQDKGYGHPRGDRPDQLVIELSGSGGHRVRTADRYRKGVHAAGGHIFRSLSRVGTDSRVMRPRRGVGLSADITESASTHRPAE